MVKEQLIEAIKILQNKGVKFIAFCQFDGGMRYLSKEDMIALLDYEDLSDKYLSERNINKDDMNDYLDYKNYEQPCQSLTKKGVPCKNGVLPKRAVTIEKFIELRNSNELCCHTHRVVTKE